MALTPQTVVTLGTESVNPMPFDSKYQPTLALCHRCRFNLAPLGHECVECRRLDKLRARKHRERLTECSCGCGATKPDDGLCECGKPLGHN